MPPEITWRVVSSPPMRMSSDSWMISSSAEAVAVDLGVDEDAHQVVAGLGLPGGDHLGGVERVLDEGVAGGLDLLRGRLGGEALEHVVGPPEQVGAVLGPHAEGVADHDHRQVGGHLVDEVALAALDDGIDDLACTPGAPAARCRAPGGG